MKAMRRLSGFVEKDNREVNNKHNYADDKEKDVFMHKLLPFVFSDSPYIDHQSQYSRAYIEVEKRHDFALDMPDNFTAMLRNNAVKAAPAVNVNQGVLLTAPGTKTPTTSDANKSFAPSRKKSEIISKPSLCSMLRKSTTQAMFCQGETLYASGKMGQSLFFFIIPESSMSLIIKMFLSKLRHNIGGRP